MDDEPQDRTNSAGHDDELSELVAKHHELEGRLHELTERPYLSEPEQVEEVTLKKRKLQIKDRIEDIRRRRDASLSPLQSAQAHG
ncbi:MAG: YdcH family protein [Vicinamibacterales bacterium]